jgi:hypothetical protein
MARQPHAGDEPAELLDGSTVHTEAARLDALVPGDQVVLGSGRLVTVCAVRRQRDRAGRWVYRVELRLPDRSLAWLDGRPARVVRRVAAYGSGQ